jgi:hypothetical protein
VAVILYLSLNLNFQLLFNYDFKPIIHSTSKIIQREIVENFGWKQNGLFLEPLRIKSFW